RHDLPLALIMIDIDFFKNVNDQYGHAAGDQALDRVSELLRRFVRTGDMAARIGGEEFAVACLSTSEKEAEALAQRLREEIAEEFITYDDHTFSLTVSVGIALNQKGEEVQSLLRKADLALYRAKAHGRNQVYRYDAEAGDLPSGIPSS
ncbi:MAG: GGDEF domain-containing protein, partial [Natronospirillum sp.]